MTRRPVLPVVAGVVAGFVAGWWWGRTAATDPGTGQLPADPPIDDGWADRWGERVDAAMGAAATGFRTVGARWRAPVALDEARLADALAAVGGAGRLRAAVLGDGLVEVVGTASDTAATAAVGAVRAVPGVRVVVNRVWTPSSAHPGQIDDLPGFG